jgi:flagellar biosynthetic protein FlhB
VAETDDASKTEEPSAKKLADAREKGDLAKSQDVTQLAALLGAFAAITIAGGWLSRDMANALQPFLAHAGETALDSGGAVAVARAAVWAAAPTLLIVLLTTAACGAAGNLLQTGFLFTPDKLKPDFKKLDLIKGMGRLLGIDSLVQFAKSATKFIVTGIIAWFVIKPHATELRNLVGMDPAAILPLAMKLCKTLFIAVLIFLALTAGFDWFWQRLRFNKRMRMSIQEMKDEFKQADGDPHIKARLRQIRHQRSRQRMMQAVPKATVVVMNPTHYAVALMYDADETPAPLCVAKGMDSLALKIREVAEAAGVPIIEDPPLARALYATVEIDEQIPEAHFAAVAKVIGFILNGRKPGAQARGR